MTNDIPEDIEVRIFKQEGRRNHCFDGWVVEGSSGGRGVAGSNPGQIQLITVSEEQVA